MRGQERERLLWLDLLRIWSCFWVIVSHVQSPFYWRDKIGNGTWGGVDGASNYCGYLPFCCPMFYYD